jgi:hypothetical protein
LNLNKFTKQELIDRFKKQQSKSNRKNNQSIFTTIIDIFSNFKVLILKITLIALIFKMLKKYSLIRKL